MFDSSLCGVRIRSGPEYDSGSDFTVQNFMGAVLQPGNPEGEALVPPYTPPGLYGIRIPSSWAAEEFLHLSVINTDSVEHTCLGFGYLLAVTLKLKS